MILLNMVVMMMMMVMMKIMMMMMVVMRNIRFSFGDNGDDAQHLI